MGRKNSRTICGSAAGITALDIQGALARFEGDQDLLDELVQLFAEECPGMVSKIRRALETGESNLLERLAHTLKGASANVGAEGIHRAAAALETDACGGDLLLAAEHFEILRVEMDLLFSELQSAWGDEKHSFSKEPTKDL